MQPKQQTRINKFIALASGLSRRAADSAITQGRVGINGQPPKPGQLVGSKDIVTLDAQVLEAPSQTTTIMLNKPPGYVVSRDGQGSRIVYDLLPPDLHNLKPIGRLDKNSSGLLLLTNDGQLAQQLSHPKYQKDKIYNAKLSKPLSATDKQKICGPGVALPDGISKLKLDQLDSSELNWKITMQEGRNRQIRRTFEALGYDVKQLHRIQFGPYSLNNLRPESYNIIKPI